MSKIVFALCISGLVMSPLGALAADDDQIRALKAEIDGLKRELADLKGERPVGDVNRFDGRWRGEITRDDNRSCPGGEIEVVVRAGKMEGTRWIRSQPAPAKGVIAADGSFEGYTNRAVMLGKFTETTFEGYWPDQGCPLRKAYMAKVG